MLNTLKAWYQQAAGSKIATIETKFLSDILPMLFGYYLVQLGDALPARCLKRSPILRQISVRSSAENDNSGTGIQAAYTALPFLEDSIDVILLPHVLEFSEQPELILQEAWRVLLPEGHLIITGFNPWSFLGFWRWLKHKHIKTPPWNGKFLSLFKIRCELQSLGCDITEEKTFFFRPPTDNVMWLKKLRFLEIVGQYCWPYAGGVYIVIAKKKVVTLTPIKPEWAAKKLIVNKGYVEPAARSHTHETH